jgi:hypothetical protein
MHCCWHHCLSSENIYLQADIWPPCPSLPDLKTNTSDLAAGIQGIEGVLRAKQESHVKQFLLTEAALQAGHAAQQQLQALSAEVQRWACLDILST